MAAHLGLSQLRPLLSAAAPGDDTGKGPSGCAPLPAVPAAGRREQHVGCFALGLLFLCILPLERPVVAFRSGSCTPRDAAGGSLI